MSNKYEEEIIRLHHFFVDWFTGKLPNTDTAFLAFESVMADKFAIIHPSGQLSSCGQIVDSLKKAHNMIPDIKIWIENVSISQELEDIAIVMYEEWQKRGEKTTCRLSTVVFQKAPKLPHGLRWLHVHETWLQA